MLDKEGKNIDACTIAVPDSCTQCRLGLHAARAKHVYIESLSRELPGSATPAEAAAKYKVATQMGNQGFSAECHRVAAEIVWSGAIGVSRKHTSPPLPARTRLASGIASGGVGPLHARLGSLVGRCSNASLQLWYVPYNWRGFFDFGTGQIGNWATHTAGPVHHACNWCAPTSVECSV